MSKFQLQLTNLETWDFAVSNFDGWTLTVIGGSPLNLDSPTVQLLLRGVSYLRCPTQFHYAKFRAATAAELLEVRAAVLLDETDEVIAFDAETQAGRSPKAFVIVAESIEVAACSVQKPVQ